MGSGGGVTRRAVILEEDVINDFPEHILKYLHTLLWLQAEVSWLAWMQGAEPAKHGSDS